MDKRLEDLFKAFTEQLFKSYCMSKNKCHENNMTCSNSSKLVFPAYSDGETVRVSEQEARFAFCATLEKTDNEFLYSVETPTLGDYAFSRDNGKKDAGERSACTDLTLYNKDKTVFANIEFKAHSVDIKNIDKDFKKLVGEDVTCGIFIQVFKNMDNGTIDAFFDTKLKASLGGLSECNDKKYIL